METTPFFLSDHEVLNRAARIASGDIAANCLPYQAGLLTREKICLMAGLDYDMPWTRDAAINTMNAMCVLSPEIARNTLLSVCERQEDGLYIGGQYWDCVIWALGAWQYLAVTPDDAFRTVAQEALHNTLRKLESEEFDLRTGLFMGAAVYGDGIAAYPDKYARTKDHRTGILDWPRSHETQADGSAHGLPMRVLSTNCTYYAAYQIAALWSDAPAQSEAWRQKADRLKNAILAHFWNPDTGRFDYLFDDTLRCNAAEALGLSFAILFGIAEEDQCRSILQNTPVTEQGIACLWPSFPRYRIGSHYGRHSGTVWPHAEGFWALANLHAGNQAGFTHELWNMSYRAVRDMQFAEIYHPVTGAIYGGMQENEHHGISLWKSCEKQTWSATAFWSLILYGLWGLSFTTETLSVRPFLPIGVDHMELKNLHLDQAVLHLIADRSGTAPCTASLPRPLFGEITVRFGYESSEKQ